MIFIKMVNIEGNNFGEEKYYLQSPYFFKLLSGRFDSWNLFILKMTGNIENNYNKKYFLFIYSLVIAMSLNELSIMLDFISVK